MKTPRTIHYSQLRYENIPHKRGGRARVWYLEYEYKHVWSGIYKDLRLLFWRVLKWLKIEYRKEFLFGFILLFALVPSPKPVRAQVIPVPVQPYLKTIPKLSPVVPVAFSVPDKVAPIVPPPAPVAAPVVAPPVYVPPASGSVNCGSDPLMAYIYTAESGCKTWAYNPGGCRGLGQSCPGSKLPCGDYDWACQDNWFRSYAVSAYGSIYQAYLFRSSHNWW